MSKRDYYEILGVSKDASKEKMKKAYRKIALKYHPDRNPDDKGAEDKFKEAAEAYEVLSNDDKRARYDRFGHAGLKGSGGPGFGGNMNVEDIFENFGDIFGDIFGGGRTGGGRTRGGGQRGSNLRVRVKLTLEEIAQGVQKKIKVRKYKACGGCGGSGAKDDSSYNTCSSCNGHGRVRQVANTFLGQMQTTATCPTCRGAGKIITQKCSTCQGEGREFGEDTITLDIPAGVGEGVQLSMSGKGNQGERGGHPGDLIISIEEIPHKYLKREGNDVVFTLYVNFADAAIGTTVEVPTITNPAKIKIPPGTQSGKIFRLRGKGLPAVNSYGTGDQLIEVKIWTPKRLTSQEQAILEKFRGSPNFEPNPGKNDKSFFDKVRDYFA